MPGGWALHQEYYSRVNSRIRTHRCKLCPPDKACRFELVPVDSVILRCAVCQPAIYRAV